MLLSLSEDLLVRAIGDPSVNLGILDVVLSKVVGHISDPAAGFPQVHSNRGRKACTEEASSDFTPHGSLKFGVVRKSW